MSNYYNDQWRLPNNENKAKQSNYSMNFDGTQLVLQGVGNFTSFNGVSECSVSLWFKSSTSQGPYKWFFNVPSNTSGSHGFGIYASGTGLTSHVFTTSRVEVVTSFSGNQWDGNWHHLVLTYKDGVGLRLYYDSVLQFTNNTMSGTITAGGEELAIGGFSTGYPTGGNIIAQIDGVSAFTYALSQIQITTLYGSSSTGIGNPMSLSPAPVAYYPLGDQDAFNGADYLTPNASLKDFVFDFIPNDYIDCGNDSSLNISGDLTISAWVKINNYNNFNAVISKIYSSTRNYEILIRHFGPTGGVSFYVGNSSFITSTGTVPLNTWTHIVVTVESGVTNGTKIYINGSQDATTGTLAINSNTANLNIGRRTTGSLYMDGKISNTQVFNSALPATGSNSVETLYNNGSPLTSMSGFTSLQGWWKLDASATYDGSNWTIEDSSSNSNDGTSSGMTQANLVQSDLSFKTSYSPYALNFDGTNDYIDLGTYTQGTGLALNADMSISAWIKTSNLSSMQVIICNLNSSGSSGSYDIEMNRLNNGQYGIIYNGSTVGLQGSTILSSNTWYHIVMTRTGTSGNWSYNLYLNGNPDGSATNVTQNFGNGTVAIGRFGAYDFGYFNGSISNVSIWNAGLTSTQVTEIYNEGVPSNLNNHSAYSNLVSWWQLGSNSSFNTNWTVLDEVTASGNNGTSVNMTEGDIVDGVGSYANGLSNSMGGDEIIGSAPFSDANSLSLNMDVLDRVEDTPS